VKFTEKGEIKVSAECEVRNEGADNYPPVLCNLIISVEDTGIGIPEDRLSKIFESFTQADGSVTRKYGGSGLGLTISRRLVELMNGSITVESTREKEAASV